MILIIESDYSQDLCLKYKVLNPRPIRLGIKRRNVMITEAKKGEKVWIIGLDEREIIVGTLEEIAKKSKDGDIVIIVEDKDGDIVYQTEAEDVFMDKKEAIECLVLRLTKKRDHLNKQISFLNVEFNKIGAKTIKLPVYEHKGKFQSMVIRKSNL